jgi:hypothetical protein
LVKLEVLDEGAEQYATALFDIQRGHTVSKSGPAANVSISPCPDGYYELSMELRTAARDKVHYSVALVRRGGANQYAGESGKAIALKHFRLDA